MAGEDNLSLESFFNDLVSEQDAGSTLRKLRIVSANNPIEGYNISDQQSGTTSYYGYLRKDGAWYIMKSVLTAPVTNYTYVKGASGYNWAGRAGLSYASFSATFG